MPDRRDPLFPAQFLLPSILVSALFFLWGVPNNLNDVLIRQFMKSFEISRMQSGLVQSAFYLGYFLLALPSALYMRKLGYKAGFVTGLALFGIGAFLFWPAALIARYWIFLLSLFVMASGLAFLETASNTFIALCGSEESAERRLNFAQAFNPLGSITGVLIGTIFIFSGVELSADRLASFSPVQYQAYLHGEILRVVRPYIVLGIIAVAWALLILLTPFPRLRDEETEPNAGRMHPALLLRQKGLLASIVAQFFYVGAQVGTWSYFISYVQDYSGRGEKVGGYFLTGTLCMFAGGRFISAWLMKFLAPARLMAIYSAVNILLVALGVCLPGWIGIWAIFFTSFFMSLMYPTIFALGIEGLGSSSKVGGSLLVMAIIGGAVLTPVMGIIADVSKHLAWAYTVPLAGYFIVALYSLGRLRRRALVA